MKDRRELIEFVLSEVEKGEKVYKVCKDLGVDSQYFYENLTEKDKIILKDYRVKNSKLSTKGYSIYYKDIDEYYRLGALGNEDCI
jgi:succinate dehydrogenase/fumarate reductase-like Fe-S protein